MNVQTDSTLAGSTVPIFAAENSPSQIRGALVMGWQLWVRWRIVANVLANVVDTAVLDRLWYLPWICSKRCC
jgi:hypothetical protein